MSTPIIGIDLGTTNSVVAVVEQGKMVVIHDAECETGILPSIVGLNEEGGVMVGQSARNQYLAFPERTIRSIKRKMGSAETVQLGDSQYTPQEISAIVLKRLKKMAENHLGVAVSKAVITVPAYFSDAQRQATREAGEMAGLEVVRIINEPTAAALAYEVNEQNAKKVLVYDLGGGTFDVSIVSMHGGVVEVLSSHGNNHLGGDDFDLRIVEKLLDVLREQGVDVTENPRAMARLERCAENAKIHLSDNPYAPIDEVFLTTHNGEPVHLSYELSRNDYEDLIEDYIDETLQAVQIALEGANLKVGDIDEVLLVGGSTRTPVVRNRLLEVFDQAPRGEIHPDLCVAMGAAIHAAMMSGEKVSTVLVDVTPYTFGTSALSILDGQVYPFCYVPIIKKNSSLPISKSEVFWTCADGQTEVEVNIYQGEEEDALNNIPIGQFMVNGLSNVPAGSPVILNLTLDINGILKVTAIEKNTGFQKSVTIDNALARLEDSQIQNARERLATLFGDESATVPVTNTTGGHKLATQAKALMEKAQRLLEVAGNEDKEDLINHIETLQDALVANDEKALEASVSDITDLIYFLET